MMSLLIAAMMLFQADDDFPFGPLDQHAHGLFQAGLIGFVPDAPTNLKQDQFQVHMSLSTVNILNSSRNSPTYAIDMEFERLSLNMWYGATDRLQIGVQVPFEAANGGFLDDFIAGFHKTFGLNLASRDEFGRDQIGVTVGGNKANVHPTMGLGNVMVLANYQILQAGDYPGWSIGCQIKIPSSTLDYITRHEFGIGFSTNIFYQTGNWYYNLGLSIAHTGDEGILDQKTRSFVETMFFMVEYRITDWLSAVGQTTFQSGPVVNFGEYSKWSLYVDGGFKIRLDKNITWDVGFFENVIKYENSADFGLFTGITLKY